MKEPLFPVLRLVVSRVLRLYATCSSSRVPIRCPRPLDPSDIAPDLRGSRSSQLPREDPRSDVDEIGYKFICSFKRDIVSLLDKANGQSYVSTSGSRYFFEDSVSCYWREKLSLARGCRYHTDTRTQSERHREKKRTKYDVIKRQGYELTGFGNYYVEVVNSRIINWAAPYFFLSSYTRVVVRYARRQDIGLVDWLGRNARASLLPTYLPARAPRTL